MGPRTTSAVFRVAPILKTRSVDTTGGWKVKGVVTLVVAFGLRVMTGPEYKIDEFPVKSKIRVSCTKDLAT